MTELYHLPEPSSARDGGGPRLTQSPSGAYEVSSSWENIRVLLTFHHVKVVNCRHYGAIPHGAASAYDAVVDCGPSIFLAETMAMIAKKLDVGAFRHLAVYFDDGPYYEFICKDFEVEEISNSHAAA